MSETPAQELRSAANIMRGDAAWPSEDLTLAVADLLDVAAERLDINPFGAEEFIQGALKIARAYMGTKEATDGD